MSRPLLIALVLALGACQSPPAQEATAPRAPVERAIDGAADRARAADRVVALGEAVVRATWEESPERVAMLRPPGARHDALPDLSKAGLASRRAREDTWRAELLAMDRPALGQGTTGGLAWDLAMNELQHRFATRTCENERWAVHHLPGSWISTLTVLGQVQPVGTPELRAQLLTRWRAVPLWVEQHMAQVREGLGSGHLPPQTSVRLVIEQLDRLLAMPVEATPFYGPALRDPDVELRRSLAAAVNEAIVPTLKTYRTFIDVEVRPRARAAPSVAANTQGAACYQALLRRYTTLDVDPGEVALQGEKQLAVLEAKMKQLVDAKYGGGPVRAVLDRLRTDPARRYRDREAMLDQARRATERATAALPRLFGKLPVSKFVLEPIPAFQEKSMPPHYLAAALDGSRPAAYRVRLYKPEDEPRSPGEAIAFHETVPGHHLQTAIANESQHLPMAARFSFVPAFSEGWALYAEEVADELGLYSSDDDRMGMLSSAAWRATRLVVDTGLHARGWDRQRAIDELLAHTTISPAMAASEIDRYIAWPGQATAYMMGYLEITRLRRRAEQALGPRFDLRAFHDMVLENGHVPLALLDRHAEAWIAAKAGAPAR